MTTVSLLHGSCLDRIRETRPDMVLCDPPYLISFMGRDWDAGGLGIEFCKEWLAECYTVLPPGGMLAAYMATRTMHLLAQAMEDVGFVDISLKAWVYGSGFPKSLNVAKALDKMAGAERESKKIPFSGNAMMRHGGDNTRPWIEKALEVGYHELPGDEPATDEAKVWDGWGTALKPAWEPVIIGRKPE